MEAETYPTTLKIQPKILLEPPSRLHTFLHLTYTSNTVKLHIKEQLG